MKSILKAIGLYSLAERTMVWILHQRTFFGRFNPFISSQYLKTKNNKILNLRTFRLETPKLNLVIIGAQKSGTTTLYGYLGHHKDIFMSSPLKEPGYFRDFNETVTYFKERRGLSIKSKDQLMQSYMLNGYRGEKYLGEATTVYTLGQNSVKYSFPRQMKKYNREMKLVYIIRNPIDRILSHYRHLVSAGYTSRNLEEEIRKNHSLISTSSYHYQLEMFLEHFPKSQIHILRFEDLVSDPLSSLNLLCDFLEIDGYDYLPGGQELHLNRSTTQNVSTGSLSPKALEFLVQELNEDQDLLSNNFGIEKTLPSITTAENSSSNN